jgi:hypothetical protein
MPRIFNQGDVVVFILDPDPEPVIVQESNFHRTSVKTMDGIDISHATELLEPFEIPSAI